MIVNKGAYNETQFALLVEEIKEDGEVKRFYQDYGTLDEMIEKIRKYATVAVGSTVVDGITRHFGIVVYRSEHDGDPVHYAEGNFRQLPERKS